MSLRDAPAGAAPAEDRAGPVRPPPRAGFSMKAAMIVPGLGVLILVVFIGANFLTSNPVQRPNASAGSFSVAGTPLRAEPAARILAVITVAGQPPGNILNAVSVPEGARRVSFQNDNAAAQQYDSQITLTTDASQGAVENFYSKVLKHQGWQIFSTGPADHNPGAQEVLAKKAGSDGYYWELGAVVSATTFGAGAPPAGVTRFTLELFQQPDPA